MRIAIITGASSGMGRQFALQLPKWERFDEIWLIARRADRLEALAAELPVPARVLPLDLSSADGPQALAAVLEAEQPEVGVLVCAAGYGKFGRVDEMDREDQLGMIDLNCRALTAVTMACLPCCTQGSKLVALGSLSAFQPVPWMAVYGASKAYVLSFTRALNAELKQKGIRAMAVCPGWVRTEFFQHAEREDKQAVTYFNRWYEADEVVAKALRDLYRTKKDVSICGAPVRNQVRLVKLLPHRLVMKVWLKQQGHG